MLVRDIMSRDVDVLSPEARIMEAARHMRDRDIGSIPIAENDRLVGMLTDRDIVTRHLAAGHDGDGAVREAMTDAILYCYENQDIDDVARNMSEQAVRRLPVLDRGKRLVGIVSLGDIAKAHDAAAGAALEEIAEAPGETGSKADGYTAGMPPL